MHLQERFQVKNPPHTYIQKLRGYLDPGVTRKVQKLYSRTRLIYAHQSLLTGYAHNICDSSMHLLLISADTLSCYHLKVSDVHWSGCRVFDLSGSPLFILYFTVHPEHEGNTKSAD